MFSFKNRAKTIFLSNTIKFTISAGVSYVKKDFDSSFAEADRALYHAKESGKNMIL